MTDSRSRIKSLFRSGTIPSERDFAALIDMMVPTDVFETTIASIRDTDKPTRPASAPSIDLELSTLRREKQELEARLDREIAALRQERSLLKPLAEIAPAGARNDIDTASAYLEREIAALRDERQAVLQRQDREIAALKATQAGALAPAPAPPAAAVEKIVVTPSAHKGQVDADGAWHKLAIDDQPGAFSILATMAGPAPSDTLSATYATIVLAGPKLRPNIRHQSCFAGRAWLVLIPLGLLASTGGAFVVVKHGVEVWRSYWSAAGAMLALIGIAVATVGYLLHRRHAISIVWRRDGGVFALVGPGGFHIRSNAKYVIDNKVQSVSYTVSDLDA